MRSLEDIVTMNSVSIYLDVDTDKHVMVDSTSLIYESQLGCFIKWEDRKIVYTEEDIKEIKKYKFVKLTTLEVVNEK